MKAIEFSQKVNNKEIKNGSKFKVYNSNDELVGTVGVIDTTVVYLEMQEIPTDILMGDYIYELIEEEQK